MPFASDPRFRRPHLLIVGCGDIGMRVLRLLAGRYRVLVLSSSPQRFQMLRDAGALPLPGDLDKPATLSRLGGLADVVLHLAPPPAQGVEDLRTRHLLQALGRRPGVRRIVYGSTSAVYGDAGGDFFGETRSVAPRSDRARRRVDAEQQLRCFGLRFGVAISLLRIPGIYARDRTGGHPRERLLRGTPVLHAEEDVFTNHIHADDLARACVAALRHGMPMRAINVCDDSQLMMGDYFDLAADLCGLPRPPRVSRAEMVDLVSPMALSFISESRRLDNSRLKVELGVRLLHPTVHSGL